MSIEIAEISGSSVVTDHVVVAEQQFVVFQTPPPTEPAYARTNWQSYCVRLPERCDQRQVMQTLLDSGIASKRGVMCAHRSPAYLSEPWTCGPAELSCTHSAGACERLRQSELAEDRSLMLPLYLGLTDDDQDRVVTALARACREVR